MTGMGVQGHVLWPGLTGALADKRWQLSQLWRPGGGRPASPGFLRRSWTFAVSALSDLPHYFERSAGLGLAWVWSGGCQCPIYASDTNVLFCSRCECGGYYFLGGAPHFMEVNPLSEDSGMVSPPERR